MKSKHGEDYVASAGTFSSGATQAGSVADAVLPPPPPPPPCPRPPALPPFP